MTSIRPRLPRLAGSLAAFLVAGSGLRAAGPLVAGPGGEDPAARPNIVFILADDLGYGDLGCYGQKDIRTPAIDRMAAEGLRFTDYYAGSTVCAPSRCALLTGYHTGHARIRGNAEAPLLPEDVTVAEVLKGAGYSTCAIGKWGLGLEGSTGHPSRQGFDEWFGYLNQSHAHRHTTDHLWRNELRVEVGRDEYTHDLFTREAMDFIRRRRDGPFFLYLAYTIPHAELRVPGDSLAEYRGKFPEAPFTNRQADAHPSRGYRSQPEPAAALAGMITRMDRDVGRILDLLGELGIDSRTAVFFSSDNGPHAEGGRKVAPFRSSGPFRGWKRDLYEGGIRVPMIVRWPGRIAPGAVSAQVWAHWDFLPTAAEIAGVAAPAGMDGVSMLPALLGARPRERPCLYWEFHERGFEQAVRAGRWKAVRRRPWEPVEVYDLEADPGELRDLARARSDVARRLQSLLVAARRPSERWKPRVKL